MATAPMVSGAFSALLSPDLRRVYINVGKERPLEYPMLLNSEGMEWNPMTDREFAGLGTMSPMPEGDRFPMDAGKQGNTKTYTATPYGMGVEITYIMWRDDLYGVMREMTAGLARASRLRKEISAWAVFNNAFDTAFPGFEAGVSLCSTTHTSFADASIVQANRPNPDIGFSITGIQNAIQRFESLVDDRGNPMLLSPVMALLHPFNRFVAREILGSSGKPYTADNEINSLLEDDLSWMISHYLTSQTAWWLTAPKGVHDCNFLVRDEPIFDSFDDPFTKNALFTVWQRHLAASTFGQWRGVDGSTG